MRRDRTQLNPVRTRRPSMQAALAQTRPPREAPKVEIFECQQGTDEWFKLRLGVPTASMFRHILAKGDGKMRLSYMRELAGERISGLPAERAKIETLQMRRGRDMEITSRNEYEYFNGVTVRQVGFVRRGLAGASPDGLVGDDGIVEFKSKAPHLFIPLYEDKPHRVPREFKAQVMGELWVCQRDWCDLKIYWPKMPTFTIRVERDQDYFDMLEEEITLFDRELRKMVERLS